MVASGRRSAVSRTNRRRTNKSNHLQRTRQIHSPEEASDGQQPLEATNWNDEKNAEARKAMAKLFYACNISFKVTMSPYFENFCNLLNPKFKRPTCGDLWGPLLAECVEEVHILIDEHKKVWVREGCTIIIDGCLYEKKGRTFINVLVASTRGIVFLKSVDASNKIKDGRKLFSLLENAVLEVGSQNVVQVITDNTTAYVVAGKILEERFPNIFWSPSAAHCIDLMLEDIEKINWVKKTMDNARIITKFIYNDSWWAINLLKQYVDGMEVIQSGVTRFATDFLTLQNLYTKRYGLKRMFVSREWMESTSSTSEEALLATRIIFDERFWETSHEIIQVFEPLAKVLHIVDSSHIIDSNEEFQDKSPMGYLYEAMNKVKEAIAGYYKNVEPKYQPFWELIDRRWSSELHKSIHAAGYYLNPKYFFDEAFVIDEEILSGLYICLERMVQDEQKIDDIQRELQIYRNAEGCLFSSALCIRSRTTLNPALWWDSFGVKTPLLQQVAIRILSQPCSSFAYELNWSRFQHIHSKKCSKMYQERLKNLLYVHYNLRLQHKETVEIDVMNLDEMDDITSEWITELETTQPSEEENFVLVENQVKQEIAAMEEEQVQAQTPATATKVNGKKRAHP